MIIGGIVLAALVLGFVAHLLLHRFGRTRPETALGRPHQRWPSGSSWLERHSRPETDKARG